MAITIQTGTGNITQAQSNSTASLACNKPTNLADGDLLIAHALFRNTAGVLTAPAGWTVIGAQESTAFTEAVYYKTVPTASAVAETSWTWSTNAGSGRANITIVRISGVDLTAPIMVNGAWTVGSAGTVTLPSLTATGPGTMIAVAARNNGSGTTVDATWGGGLVQFTKLLSGTSAICETYMASETIGASGATGTRTVTMTPQTVTVGQSFILKPAVTNTPPVADAGPDQTDIEPFATFELDGSGSSDAEGSVTYLWEQIDGATVTLSATNVAKPTGVAPATMDGDTLTFRLTVTDSNSATDTDTVDITVLAHNEWYRVSSAWVPARFFTRVSGSWV